MADSATVATGSDGPADETPNQRQARLRREKRQKKMAEQGEDRLAKIKALNGGVAPPEEVLGGRKLPECGQIQILELTLINLQQRLKSLLWWTTQMRSTSARTFRPLPEEHKARKTRSPQP
jgi:hypothetical protein